MKEEQDVLQRLVRSVCGRRRIPAHLGRQFPRLGHLQPGRRALDLGGIGIFQKQMEKMTTMLERAQEGNSLIRLKASIVSGTFS